MNDDERPPRARRPRRRDDDDDYDDDYDDRPRREHDIGQDPAMRMLLPVGLSGYAIAAGYLGLISVLCVPAPFAVIFGILAIREIRRNPKKHGMGRSIFGIVMGGGIILLTVVVSILAAAKGR